MCHAASKRARGARRAQEKAATPEKRPAVDKVVQNAVLNGMPTLAAANPAAVIIVTILTAMTAVQFWNTAPPLSTRARAFVAVNAEQPPPAAPPCTSRHSRLPEFANPYADEAKKFAKHAWLIESGRADRDGDEISDANLDNLYSAARKQYQRHSQPLHVCLVHSPCHPCPECPRPCPRRSRCFPPPCTAGAVPPTSRHRRSQRHPLAPPHLRISTPPPFTLTPAPPGGTPLDAKRKEGSG